MESERRRARRGGAYIGPARGRKGQWGEKREGRKRKRTPSRGEKGDEDADLPRKRVSVKQKRRDRGDETHEGDEAVLSGLVVT